MIPRYEQAEITGIWSDKSKLELWQETELAGIKARVVLGELAEEVWLETRDILRGNPIDIDWWKARDKEIGHDLNAFIDERVRFLPPHLALHFHEDLTSYDTEEPAFARMLERSSVLVEEQISAIIFALEIMAIRYRYTIMMGRTHGQEAELQTFGKRCLAWRQDLRVSLKNLQNAKSNLKYSKLSGAVGSYGSINPALEKEALNILGFQPYYGATQIMPRELYAPLAGAFCQVVMTLDKIATAIRLGARSGQPIYQEPFGRRQKGSSRMPHKKNTISTEQIEGMARLAHGYSIMIMPNIKTWEERAIEQSCVERVAWPDLFHVVLHSLRTMARVLKGLAVYPDNMLREVIDSRGCYASGEVKKFLSQKGLPFGLSTEEAYRIVQLAAFNVFEPPTESKKLRESSPRCSLGEANDCLLMFQQESSRQASISIKDVILKGELRTSEELEASEDDVERWNEILRGIFQDPKNVKEFHQVFSAPFLLRNEAKLYQEILDVGGPPQIGIKSTHQGKEV